MSAPTHRFTISALVNNKWLIHSRELSDIQSETISEFWRLQCQIKPQRAPANLPDKNYRREIIYVYMNYLEKLILHILHFSGQKNNKQTSYILRAGIVLLWDIDIGNFQGKKRNKEYNFHQNDTVYCMIRDNEKRFSVLI